MHNPCEKVNPVTSRASTDINSSNAVAEHSKGANPAADLTWALTHLLTSRRSSLSLAALQSTFRGPHLLTISSEPRRWGHQNGLCTHILHLLHLKTVEDLLYALQRIVRECHQNRTISGTVHLLHCHLLTFLISEEICGKRSSCSINAVYLMLRSSLPHCELVRFKSAC